MGFAWKRSEPLDRGLRRIADEQISAAVDTLEDERLALDERVHDLRKRCKKLRALLRLARSSLGDETYQRENASFRELSRQLAGSREAFIRLQTFDRLSESLAANLETESLARLGKELSAREQSSPVQPAESVESRVTKVVVILREAAARVHTWTIHDKKKGVLEAGLRRTQDRGRRALKRARKKPTPERLHEWRKRVKDGGYHIRLLSHIWPAEMKLRRKAYEELGEVLGADHDLADFSAALQPLASDGHADSVLAMVDRAQHEREGLQAKAWKLGASLYTESGKALRHRYRAHYMDQRA